MNSVTVCGCYPNGGTYLGFFQVFVESIKIKFLTASRFLLEQLDYSLSISMRDS